MTYCFRCNTLIGLNFARLNFARSKIREIFNFANEKFEKIRVDLVSRIACENGLFCQKLTYLSMYFLLEMRFKKFRVDLVSRMSYAKGFREF